MNVFIDNGFKSVDYVANRKYEFYCHPYLGYKHAAQGHSRTEADTEAHRDDLVVGAEVDGYEGQPDDAGGIHGKGYVLGLIEIGRDIAGLPKKFTKEHIIARHPYTKV